MTLTPADYAHLSKVVKVEAALNTMDEQCVAVSVLNRVRSPKFPNNVSRLGIGSEVAGQV